MSFPSCKVELYDREDALQYTLDSQVVSAHVHNILTSDVGSFTVMVPNEVAGAYPYSDVATNWTVKIYMGYGVLDADDLLQYGRILKIRGHLNTGEGFGRVFEGKDLGEILTRRIKFNRRYQDLDASTIVAVDIAGDLGIYDAAKVVADATDETITIPSNTYFDYLSQVSDYWYNAGTKVQKDFYVDAEGELVWKARPIRSVGVETITLGTNVLDYVVTRDILPVKNSITVFGAATAPLPRTKDDWSDSLDEWSASAGVLALYAVAPKAGTNWINCSSDAGTKHSTYKLDLYDSAGFYINIKDITNLRFWHHIQVSNADTAVVRLLAPDDSNYFETVAGTLGTVAGIYYNNLPMGESTEVDADVDEENNAVWDPTGNPNWWKIEEVEFDFHDAGAGMITGVDKLYFWPDRWSSGIGTVTDATSVTNSEQRDACYTFNSLRSDDECTKRAQSLLMQLKDEVIGLGMKLTVGTSNMKIGDRLSITIPAEELSAASFDVVSVDYDWTQKAFETSFVALNSSITRNVPPGSHAEALNKQIRYLREATSNFGATVVR